MPKLHHAGMPDSIAHRADSADNPYRLYAHIGSPYSMKMRALLRYRRIPHLVMGRMSDWRVAFQNVRVPVMPVLEYPDGRFLNDSTPLILDLEARHAERSVIPTHEADAFLAALIEDLADEWLSKAMYAYRWAFPEHTQWTGRLIAFDQHFGGGREKVERAGHAFETRQVGRNSLVGCTDANLPMLVHIAEAVLDALEPSLTEQPFLFGHRPSNADFGLFGQLCQFSLDLAAIEPCQARAPYTMRWVHHVHDLSGHEGVWRDAGEPHCSAVHALLELAGQAYLPFLIANEAAIAEGAEAVRIEAHGLTYAGSPFKYQAKCLAALRRGYAALSESARSELDPLLAEHGCLSPLGSPG
jgi:glutathione S-transferase